MALEDGNCRSLGSRMTALENAAFNVLYNDAVDFEISAWVLEGKYYSMTITPDIHMSVDRPMFQIYEKLESEYHSVALDSIILKDNGDLKVLVLSEPDLRFQGRFIFDE